MLTFGVDICISSSMYIRVRRFGLTKGSLLLAAALGIASGVYIYKPMFDPAEKDKLSKLETPAAAGKCVLCIHCTCS